MFIVSQFCEISKYFFPRREKRVGKREEEREKIIIKSKHVKMVTLVNPSKDK